MSIFKMYGRAVNSIFQLLGYKENDISHSIAWVLGHSQEMLRIFLKETCGITNINMDDVEISIQTYDKLAGITDIEIQDGKNFYIIVEAKRGWSLPGQEQLQKYANRETFKKSAAVNKRIITLSECSRSYADHYLAVKDINGIPIIHVAWKDIYDYAEAAHQSSSNAEKRLLNELKIYLRGLTTMQNQTSNEVYVVSLSIGAPQGSTISWIDIVKTNGKYFHPMGVSGWPKEPPNYIAFRYYGKVQSVHHIDSYAILNNMHEEISELPDENWDIPHFVYRLGPAIIPPKEVKTGNVYPNGRVWCHLDILLTAASVSEARDLTKKRMER